MSRLYAHPPHGSAPAGSRPVLFGILALCLLLPRIALAFTGIELLPADAHTGVSTDHELRFTTEQNFNNGSRIEIAYPAGFDLSGVTLGPTSGLGGAVHNLNISGQTLVVTRTGFNSAPGAKSLAFNGVVNHGTPGGYTVSLESFASNDNLAEGPNLSAIFQIVDPAPDHLELTPSQGSVTAGAYLSLRLDALDATDSLRPPGSDQALDLISSSPSGSFHASSGGPMVSSAVLLADSTGLILWYRDPSLVSSPVDLTVLDTSGNDPALGFAQASVGILAGPVDAAQSSVLASTPVVADGVDFSTVDLLLRDALGNPVAGVDSATITLSLPVPGFAVDKLQSLSGADGSFSARVRSLDAGDHLLDVDVGGVGLDDRPSIRFDLRPVDSTLSSLSAGPDVVADGVAAIPLDLVLQDALGRAVAGLDSAQITFTVLDGPGQLSKLDASSDAIGAFSAELRSTTAGARRVTARVDGVDLADTVSVVFTTGPIDASQSSVILDAPALADGVDFITVGLVLRDAQDNPVAALDSTQIVLSLADASIQKMSASTGAGGSFVARLRSTRAGDRPLSVRAAGVLLDDTPTASFFAGAADSARSVLAVGPPATADGTDPVSLTLTLHDAFDNPLAGVDSARVSFILDPAWQLTKLDAVSDASGVFRAQLRSTVAGAAPTRALLDGSAISSLQVVTFTTGAVSASRSSVSLDGPAAADGLDPILASIVLRDAFDNPIAGLDSSFIVLSHGNASILELDSASGLDGSFRAELRSSVAGLRPLGVMADGVGLDDSPLAQFVVGAVDSVRSSFTALPGSQVADGVQNIALELTLRDAFDNPVAGVDSARVQFDGHPAWQLTKLDGVSDASGRFRAEFRSSLASAGDVVARVDGVAQAAPISLEFVAGALDYFDLSLPDGPLVIAGQPARLRLEARDAQDNRILGYLGTSSLSSDTAGPGGNLSWSGGGAGSLLPQGPGLADYVFALADSGRTEVFVTNTRAESLQLRVGDGPVLDSIALQVDPASGSQLSLVSGDGQTAVVASSVPAPLRVLVADAFGNAVPGVLVDFTTSDGGRLDTDPGTPGDQPSVLSDVAGVAACPVWELGTLAGSQSAQAGTGFGGSVIFGATALPSTAVNLRLEPDGAQGLEVGSGMVVAARASDLYDNPVSGLEVTLFVSDVLDGVLAGVGETDSLGLSQQRGSTAADGRVRVRYTAPSTAGMMDVLDATAAGFPATAVNDLVLTAVEGSATVLRLDLPVPAIRAGDEGSFSLRLLDAFGNDAPASSATVELRTNPATGLEFSAASGGPFSNALDLPVLGAHTVFYRGGPAGLHDFTAGDAAAVLSGDSGQLEILSSLQVSYFTLAYPANAVAGVDFTLQVDAYDAWDNLAVDASENLDFDLVDAGDSTVVLPVPLAVSGGSLSVGRFVTAAQRIEVVGDYALRLGNRGLGTVGSALRVDPASAHELVATSPDSLWAVTAGDAVELEVEARDVFGNPVPGETLSQLLLEGGALESTPPTTGIDGRALFRLRTASTVGTARLRVGILDGNPVSRESALFVIQTQAGAVASLSVELSDTLMVAGSNLALTVHAFDAGGNPALAAVDAVDLRVVGSGALLTPSGGDLSGGVLAASVRDTLVGSFRVEAELRAAPAVSAQSELLRVLSASADHIVALGATVFDAPAGGRSGLRSRVEDRFGNPVPDELVRLALLASPPNAGIEDADPPVDDGLARSDAGGRVDFDLLLSATTGSHLVRASILDAVPVGQETVDWMVTGISGAADHLVLSLPSDTLVAGLSEPLTIRVEDAADNLVDFDGELALMFTPNGASTVPDPVFVSGGVATAELSAFAAGSLDLVANLVLQPGVTGSLSALVVVPNLASGNIPIPLVDPNPNTANGLAVTRLEAGPVVDAFGNPVAAGTQVDLNADGGAWISEDMDLTRPGLQRWTDASGRLEVRLVAPTSASTVIVDLVVAMASGQASLQFSSPAQLTLDGSATPSAAIPGQSLSFRVPVRNVGGFEARLSAALSSISVDDGQGSSFVAVLGADTTIPPASTVELVFVATVLPVGFAPGSHRPALSLAGLDPNAQAISAFLVLPQGALQVGALAIRAVQHPLQAIVGDTIEVRVEVENLGGGPVEVAELALSASPLGDFRFVDRDPLPTVAPGAQQSLASRWIVGPATNAGSYRFVARVTGRVGGSEFFAPEDSSASPLVVGTSSQLEWVAGGIAPDRTHHGVALSMRVTVRNTGGVTVDLDPFTTTLSMGGGAWIAPMSGAVALPPSGEGVLSFEPTLVPAVLGSGAQELRLHLVGDEGGRPVVVDLVAPAAVWVETPAAITLAATPLDPVSALRGASIPLRLSLDNSGEATIVLDPLSTRLWLGEPVGRRISTLLDASSDRDLDAGPSQLLFQNLALPLDLLLADPVGHVELRGSQNGEPFAQDLPLPASAFSVQDPAGLRILATESLHPRAPSSEVNAAQTITVRVVVGNAGGDAIDSLLVQLNGNAVPPSSSPELLRPRLAAGATDTLLFDVDLTTSFGPELLRARIVRAVSALTGEPVVPEASLDDVASLTVQRPVALDFVAEWVGSIDPVSIEVSPGQVFEMRIALERIPPLDSQGDWIPVEVDLSGLGGFTLEPGSTNPTQLSPQAPESVLRLRAPPLAELANLQLALRSTALDANDPSASPLPGSERLSLTAEVVGGTAFDLCELRIVSPLGALDRTLSTAQAFVVEGELEGPANLQDRALELLLPPELALVGGSARQDLIGGATTVSWQLQSSGQAASGVSLRVVAHGRDLQSAEVIADTCSSLGLEIVAAAEARAILSILAPSSARDRGELAPGGIVEFEGGFALSGTASAVGSAQLRIELPAGFTLLDGAQPIQTLSDPRQTVRWRAQGPSQIDLGVQTIRLHTESAALDENAGTPVIGAGESDAVALTILADPLRLQLSDLDPTRNLISSDRIYDRVRLELFNGHGEVSRLTLLEFRVVDDAGNDHPDPSRFLQTLQLRREDGAGSWSVPAGMNPIRIVLDSAVGSDRSVSFLLGIQAREGASGISFAFLVEASTASILDPNDFPLSYTLLDANGVGRSPIIVGASVTSSTDPQLATHSYPNPFVPSREDAILTYQLAQDSPVDIEIFDLLGERVRQWSFQPGEPQSSAGLHDGDVTWDGRNGFGEPVRNGVYVCRFRAEGSEVIFRIAVTR